MAAVLCLLAFSLGLAAHTQAQDESSAELRGAWITWEDLARLPTRKEISSAMEVLADAGLNAVFPPVRAGTATADRDVLGEILFEAHRRGLEVLPRLDPNGTTEDAAVQSVLELCQSRDLDGVVGTKPLGRLQKEIAALGVDLVVVAAPGAEVAEGEAAFRLPELSTRAPEQGGQILIGLAKLLEKEGELARSLREGPFAEDARLPWRKDRTRRPPSSPIEAFAGGGVWTWMTIEGEPRFLAMDGGETGHASWRFEPDVTGNYVLWAWIPSREDLAARSSFKIASAGGMRTVGIDTSDPRKRGWVFLGQSRLTAGKPLEVARIEAEERDATKITAAGPLLVLRSHLPKPR